MSDFSRRRCGLHVAVQTLKVTHLNFFVRNEIKKLPPFFFVGIDAYLCPMSAALERSKMDDEK